MTASGLSEVILACRPQNQARPNILRTLLTVQESFGHVPGEAVAQIADALDVPEADVRGVLSYYPDLRTEPAGRHVVRLCMGEACVANRASELLRVVREDLGIGIGETTAGGLVTLERVYCLGNCGVGPTVMVDDRIYGRVTGTELHAMLKEIGCQPSAISSQKS